MKIHLKRQFKLNKSEITHDSNNKSYNSDHQILINEIINIYCFTL